MRILEIVLMLLSGAGFALSMTLIGGGQLLFTLSMILLALLYLFFGFALLNHLGFRAIFKKGNYQGLSAQNILTAVFAGFVLSILVVALVFGLSDWIGKRIVTLSALGTLAIALIVLVILGLRHPKGSFKPIWLRILPWGGLAVLLLLIPPNGLLAYRYRAYPEYIHAMEQFRSNPQNPEYQKALEQAQNEMIKKQWGSETGS